MDYIGSKVKITEWIFNIILESLDKKPSAYTFLDACSGSGVISRYASKIGFSVISNDIMKFPSAITNGSIGLSLEQKHKALKYIEDINVRNGINGFFYNNFCEKSNPPKLYFTSFNAKKIDMFRQEIGKIKDKKISDYLLYCGIEALSRVSNTTGVQAAFLKQYKERARKPIKLKPESTIEGKSVSFSYDISILLSSIFFRKLYKEDILYIDPPYNQRQYGPNYHLYETFVRGDNPEIYGKTGLRKWKEECYSFFCTKKNCLDFLVKIIELSTARNIFVSYNSDGLFSLNDITKIFNKKIKVYKKKQIRYKSDSSKKRNYKNDVLWEYLFKISK